MLLQNLTAFLFNDTNPSILLVKVHSSCMFLQYHLASMHCFSGSGQKLFGISVLSALLVTTNSWVKKCMVCFLILIYFRFK